LILSASADVMNFLFASSDSEEDVGGRSSSSETEEDHNVDLLNQNDDSDSGSQSVGAKDTGTEGETEPEGENEVSDRRQNAVLDKDRVTVWSLLEPKKTVRTRRCNIVKEMVGPTHISKGISGTVECWSLLGLHIYQRVLVALLNAGLCL